MNTIKRKNIDLLVEKFWRFGYSAVSRKFGTYLPEPAKIGQYEVDIIARRKKNYAIGITLTEDDLNDSLNLQKKLTYLATRQTKFTNKKVLLFVGVQNEYYKNAKALIEFLEEDVKKNIRLFQIVERPIPARRRLGKQKVLFS